MAVIARPISARGLIGRAVGALRTGAAFNPVVLPGLLAYYDIRRTDTLFEDTAGVTPVAVATDPIGRWDAVGPSGAPNLTQGTAMSRLLYQLTPTRAEFDLLDDSLSVTLPAISGGQIVIVSPAGIWVDSLTFAGGTFTIGPSTYTGGPAGLLSLLSGDVTAVYILDSAMSAEDQAALVAFETARGSAGLITFGGEQKDSLETNAIGTGTATYDSGTGTYSLTRESTSAIGSVILRGPEAKTYFVDVQRTAGPSTLGVRADGRFSAPALQFSTRSSVILSATYVWINQTSNGSADLVVHSIREVTLP